MKHFFINSLEKVIVVVIVLMGIAVVVGAIGIAVSPDGGVLAALAMLIGGGLYLIVVGGLVFLGLGIYENTKRTAEAVEALVAKG